MNTEKIESFRPYLATAIFCEKVLHEKDGVLSAIRIVERINVSAGAGAPDEMPSVPVQLTALLMFKSGFMRGKGTVTLTPQSPSVKRMPEAKFPALFEGEDRGVNLVVNVGLQAEEEGLYWFDVCFEQELVTRMPLRVLYQRVGFGPSS